ncbi:autotransporter outer membrane beta-barrel domain-containing protein, partial [Sphingomonas sp.]|uniref:autotransporter outer membrane beta-barrel domain-containing protein n=1 Tax=Sphingomonas sp. TaxID=28214 RepID=UPI0031D24D22
LGNGTLAPGAGGAGTLTINGDLSMVAGSRLAVDFGAANAVGSPLNDVVNVGGNLTLDGTLNVAVTPGGAFDIGLYRILNYGGTLTDNGLAIGTIPPGADVFVQTAVANQVNLVNTGGATLNFWDGGAGANKFNNAVDGGSGMWRTGLDNSWTEATGAVNAGYANGAFAIFAGTGGVVTIDNSLGTVTASGLQFATTNYRIQGDALTLTGPQAVIRVGDGTNAGLGYSAIITSEITGDAQLVKTDLGRLELTGANSYTGGTAVNGGTLRISSDANLGAASGGLSFNGGTLNTTADISSARAVDLAGQGVFSIDANTTLTLSGNLTGTGLIGKLGAGTLVLAGTGSHTGGMGVVQGTLLVNGNYAAATGPVTLNPVATLGGTGTIGGNVNLSGTLAPGAGGAGTLTINGDLTLSQTATLAYEFGQANVAGGALNDLVNIGGDLILDGTINVTVPAGGAFSAGIYRVFNYGGTLTNNGLTLGAMPTGSNVGVQTAIAGQVNLVNFDGLALNFWDGAAGPKNDGVINGGNGVWQSSAGNDNWTEAAGLVNAGYSDGAFAVFGGTAGTVTVDNGLGQVTAGGIQFAVNRYTVTGGAIALSGGQATIRVGDGSVAGAGYTATIGSALSGASELVKTDAGTLILTGTNSYTGGTRIMGGTVQIASDANLGAAAGGATFDGGTLAATATLTSAREVNFVGAGTLSTATGTTVTLSGALAGTGTLTKAGGGTLLLTGNGGAYTGAARITAGTLAVMGAFGGAVEVRTGTRLEGSGSVGAVTNAGTVAPGRDGFGTLTINGGYTGANGLLEIDAELNGDDSRADRLVVNGATAGSTVIKVTEHGGLGAATVDGIKIVDVTGTSNGTFTLDSGDYLFEGAPALIAGAYGYRLYKNGVTNPADGDWYLRSALLVPPGMPEVPLYQPGVPVYEAYGQALSALNQIGTMQERVGNRQWAEGSARSFGIWGRSESKRARPEAVRSTSFTDTNVDSWKIELGADQVLSERSDGASLVLGLLGSYGEANASIASPYGNGSIKTRGYSAGATLSWFGPQGFYVDGRAQVTWFDSKLTSAVLGKLTDDNKGTGEAYSIEIGKRAPIGDHLSVTPQIQTIYSTVGFDRFTDPNDAAVSSSLGDSLKTRWGISLDRQDTRSHVYGVVNVSYEWLDGTITDVSGTPIARENHRLWGELGLGGSLMLGSRVTLYSEVSADTAINDFGKSYTLKGIAGLRMAF